MMDDWDGYVTAAIQGVDRMQGGSRAEAGEAVQPAEPQQPAGSAVISRAYEEAGRSLPFEPSAVAAPAEPGLSVDSDRRWSLTERSLLMKRRGYLPRCEWRPVPDATCVSSQPLLHPRIRSALTVQ